MDLIANNLQQYNQLQSNAIKTVKSLKQAGKSNELAVKRFEAEFDRNQSKLIQVKQEVIDLENEIRFLIGSPTTEIKRSQGFTHVPSLIPTQTVATQLLLNRPDIKQAEQDVKELISEGKRPLYSEGYFTMVGNEILDKVNSMTLKKYQD